MVTLTYENNYSGSLHYIYLYGVLVYVPIRRDNDDLFDNTNSRYGCKVNIYNNDGQDYEYAARTGI